jgi:transcriptional regulator with XRE-family HTH domain
MTQESWWEHVTRIAGTNRKAILARTGLYPTALSRWRLGRNPPSAELIIKFARAYDRSWQSPGTLMSVAPAFVR